jgi:UDP-N-acetylmuramoylalanine-D-glutamate ligase
MRRILTNAAASAETRSAAERDIIELLPALRALGLFDVFEVRDEKLRAFVNAH